MKKLWYYNSYLNQILQADFEERPKSYKFVNRPSGFNSVIFKDMVKRAGRNPALSYVNSSMNLFN